MNKYICGSQKYRASLDQTNHCGVLLSKSKFNAYIVCINTQTHISPRITTQSSELNSRKCSLIKTPEEKTKSVQNM